MLVHDLGFIGTVPSRPNNRNLLGSPGYGRKGVPIPAYARGQPNAARETSREPFLGPQPVDHVVGKSAAPQGDVHTTASPPLTHGMLEGRCEYLERREKAHSVALNEQTTNQQRLEAACQSLFQRSLFVYGWVGTHGLYTENGTLLAESGECVRLLYPMEKEGDDDNFRCYMNIQTVHPMTGQLSQHRCAVFEQKNGTAVRMIEKFAMAPHAR